jgi:hypothetical protein
VIRSASLDAESDLAVHPLALRIEVVDVEAAARVGAEASRDR